MLRGSMGSTTCSPDRCETRRAPLPAAAPVVADGVGGGVACAAQVAGRIARTAHRAGASAGDVAGGAALTAHAAARADRGRAVRAVLAVDAARVAARPVADAVVVAGERATPRGAAGARRKAARRSGRAHAARRAAARDGHTGGRAARAAGRHDPDREDAEEKNEGACEVHPVGSFTRRATAGVRRERRSIEETIAFRSAGRRRHPATRCTLCVAFTPLRHRGRPCPRTRADQSPRRNFGIHRRKPVGLSSSSTSSSTRPDCSSGMEPSNAGSCVRSPMPSSVRADCTVRAMSA